MQNLTGTAYSYMRFSSRKQERGDSIRRQTELRDAWLARHPGVTLDQSLTLADLGVSAFRGKHRLDDKNALSQFLRAVESGRVKTGSILIVENLDRLTREDELEATHLFTGILLSGIRIVTVEPEQFFDRRSGQLEIMRAVLELGRGHAESVRKSTLIGPAWARKRAACRESKKVVTRGAKAWLELKGDKFVFRPGAKALIRRIFAMSAGGHGARAIARILNDEGVPLWTGKPWYEMYVRLLLRGREVLGEYRQARRRPDGRREFEGEPIAGYYPAAVTEAEWLAAQVAARSRERRAGRPSEGGEFVNIFRGLLFDAPTRGRLHIMRRRGPRVLMQEGFKPRGEEGCSFPLAAFERAVLSKLAEIEPREILGGDDRPDEVAELSAEVARLDVQLKQLADMFDGDEVVPEIAAKVREKNAQRKAAVDALERAKADAASPLSAAWGECKGLVEALDQAKDQRAVRTRLRQAIARTVDSIWVLIVPVTPRGKRIAAVQLWFAGGAHRDYLILLKPAHGPSGRQAAWEVRSFAGQGGKADLDLRNPAHVADLEATLTEAAGG